MLGSSSLINQVADFEKDQKKASDDLLAQHNQQLQDMDRKIKTDVRRVAVSMETDLTRPFVAHSYNRNRNFLSVHSTMHRRRKLIRYKKSEFSLKSVKQCCHGNPAVMLCKLMLKC